MVKSSIAREPITGAASGARSRGDGVGLDYRGAKFTPIDFLSEESGQFAFREVTTAMGSWEFTSLEERLS